MKTRLLKNGLYNVAAGAVRIGLAVITIPVLIRLLGIEEYGLWTLASAVIGIVGLAEAGLSTATTVFVSRDLANEDTEGLSQTLTVTVGAMLILATLAAIALWFGAEPIVGMFPKLGQAQQSAVIQALQFGSLVVWAKLLQQVLIGVEQAYQRYGLLNLVNTMQWLLLSLGFFVMAWSGGRTAALMQWQALTSVATLLSHIWVVRSLIQDVNLRPIWKTEKGLIIANYSLMIWLISLGTALFSRGDRLIVGYLLGSETLGIYGGITEATAAINSFSALPVQPLVPVLSNQLAKVPISNLQLEQQVKQAFEVNALFALGSAAWLFMFAPLVMHIILTDAANETNILAFRIATVIYGLFSLNAVGFYILLSVMSKLVMTIQLISGCFSLIFIAIGAKNFGLLGAITGNFGFLLTLLMIFCGLKYLKLPKLLWLQSLIFPLVWFTICILFSLLTSNTKVIIIISIIQFGLLFYWFLRSQKNCYFINHKN